MSRPALSCAEAQALAPELALGILDGDDRAAILTHLAGCAKCRELVDQMAGAADRLLLLAPQAEPPPGFESRVLARMDGPSVDKAPMPLRRRRRTRPERSDRRPRRALVGVAAVALVAALAGGLALLDNPEKAGSEVHTALAEDDQGRWTCRAVAYGSDPAWLFVALDRRDGSNRTFAVEVRRTGDPNPISVGNLTLQEGHGSLATQLRVSPSELQSMRMLDDTGHVRYEADFHPSSS